MQKLNHLKPLFFTFIYFLVQNHLGVPLEESYNRDHDYLFEKECKCNLIVNCKVIKSIVMIGQSGGYSGNKEFQLKISLFPKEVQNTLKNVIKNNLDKFLTQDLSDKGRYFGVQYQKFRLEFLEYHDPVMNKKIVEFR